DFHALRCEMATLADQAGISPRVVQRLMRHSTLELTGRYTRPRALDIEAAASMLPKLKPIGDRPEAMAMTGTDDGKSSIAGSALAARTVRSEAFPVVSWRDEAKDSLGGVSSEVLASDGHRRELSVPDGMTGLGLEPRTNGLKVRCSTV